MWKTPHVLLEGYLFQSFLSVCSLCVCSEHSALKVCVFISEECQQFLKRMCSECVCVQRERGGVSSTIVKYILLSLSENVLWLSEKRSVSLLSSEKILNSRLQYQYVASGFSSLEKLLVFLLSQCVANSEKNSSFPCRFRNGTWVTQQRICSSLVAGCRKTCPLLHIWNLL